MIRRGAGPISGAGTGRSATIARRRPGLGARASAGHRAHGPGGPGIVRGGATVANATVNTNEWKGYDGLAKAGRAHATVRHAPTNREWARDDDGDEVREVHTNAMEGTWTGLRNFLRPLRGVSTWFLSQYVALFQWGHNLKFVTDEFLRILLGTHPVADQPKSADTRYKT